MCHVIHVEPWQRSSCEDDLQLPDGSIYSGESEDPSSRCFRAMIPISNFAVCFFFWNGFANIECLTFVTFVESVIFLWLLAPRLLNGDPHGVGKMIWCDGRIFPVLWEFCRLHRFPRSNWLKDRDIEAQSLMVTLNTSVQRLGVHSRTYRGKWHFSQPHGHGVGSLQIKLSKSERHIWQVAVLSLQFTKFTCFSYLFLPFCCVPVLKVMSSVAPKELEFDTWIYSGQFHEGLRTGVGVSVISVELGGRVPTTSESTHEAMHKSHKHSNNNI